MRRFSQGKLPCLETQCSSIPLDMDMDMDMDMDICMILSSIMEVIRFSRVQRRGFYLMLEARGRPKA